MKPIQLKFIFEDKEIKGEDLAEEDPRPLPWETPEYIQSIKDELVETSS